MGAACAKLIVIHEEAAALACLCADAALRESLTKFAAAIDQADSAAALIVAVYSEFLC